MLSFTDTGSGSPIVFLHGLGLNKTFWSTTIAQLSSSHRCIAVDLPGHGESRNVPVNGSMSGYATYVRELIEQLNLRDVTLVGHSMGGQISIILALQMPAVISKLVLVCPAGIETFTAEEREQMRAGANAIYRNPINEDLLKRTYVSANAEMSALLMQEHLLQQRENFQNFSTLICNSISGMLDEPVFSFLPGLTQPTLCLFGQLDTAIPNRWVHPQMTMQQVAQTAKEQIKNCETALFPLAGHYLPVDNTRELAEKIAAFI